MAVDTSSRRFLVPPIVLVLLAALAGCSSGGPGSGGLGGRTFLSTEITDGGVARALVPGSQIRLRFGTDASLGVDAGCNSMGATYRSDAGVLRVTGGATTEMGCDADRMAQDEWVFAFIGSGPTIALAGDSLTLVGSGVVMVLTDKEAADPDLPLMGPTWTVDALISGDAVSSVPAGVIATLVFSADGRVAIDAGCNQGAATWVTQGDAIRFDQIAMTKKACAGPGGRMEAALLAVLGADAVSYSIDAGSMTLRGGVDGLGLRGR